MLTDNESVQGLLKESDSHIDIDIGKALARRDFTMNAMAWDPDTLELRDPFNGRAHLDAHLLRYASDRFREDPLRVLRGMQLAARFGLTAAPETVELCKSLTQASASSVTISAILQRPQPTWDASRRAATNRKERPRRDASSNG